MGFDWDRMGWISLVLGWMEWQEHHDVFMGVLGNHGYKEERQNRKIYLIYKVFTFQHQLCFLAMRCYTGTSISLSCIAVILLYLFTQPLHTLTLPSSSIPSS